MTQKAIGPTFFAELVAYQRANNISIIGQHFSWRPDGTLEFFDDTAEELRLAVDAVYAAHDPTKAS